jgi:HTH-type transcriptional regulator / antitoxin HigA
MMDVRPLHNEADYEWALREVARYFENQPRPGSPDGDRFEVLATLIAAYEQRYHSVPDVDPVDVLHFAIESMGHTKAELGELLGSVSRASEVLNRKRKLSLEWINKISEAWRIPLEALAKPYDLPQEVA